MNDAAGSPEAAMPQIAAYPFGADVAAQTTLTAAISIS